MNLVEPKVEFIPQENGLDGLYKKIEFCGRTCYKSEDKITEDSANGFVDRMIKSGHGAMLEHGTVYLMEKSWIGSALKKYEHNKYSRYREEYLESEEVEEGYREHRTGYYVTTNLRVLVENGWLDDLKFMCEPTEYHEKRYTVKLTTDIGVTREGNRHRVNSIAEESTRYCNYAKEKFGGEVKVVKHDWFSDSEIEYLNGLDPYEDFMTYCEDVGTENEMGWVVIDYWAFAILCSNYCYNKLIENGWVAQQARTVLTLSTKSDIVYTAFSSDWKHFMDLRLFGTTGKPHPDMLNIAEKIRDEFEKNNVLYDVLN
jgi:thymidylate synthase (FAD)